MYMSTHTGAMKPIRNASAIQANDKADKTGGTRPLGSCELLSFVESMLVLTIV